MTLQQQETALMKNRILGIVIQIQTRADITIVLLTTQTPLIQHGDHADAERFWNLDTSISPKMITVLTRYRPIVLELI